MKAQSVKFQYTWTPAQAWQCAGALIAFEMAIGLLVKAQPYDSSFAGWVRSHPLVFQNVVKIVRACAWLAFAFLFSRASSVSRFAQEAGLTHRPSLAGWSSAWVAFAIAAINNFGAVRGWTSFNPIAEAYARMGNGVLVFYLLFVISVGPFFEEVVLRGFLYPAFRGRYGFLLSAVIVIGLQASFHWGALTQSWYTFACLVSLWTLLCFIRERTGNLWTCILCHAVYNAAVLMKWPLSVLILLLLLPYCARPKPQQQTSDTPNTVASDSG